MDTSLISAGLLPSGTDAGKIKALYPIVGGTAATHKFNFVNPLDTDAAFRLTFFGGWTHDANGMLPSANGYCNSYFKQATDAAQNSASFGVYYNINNSTADNSALEGCNNSNSFFTMYPFFAVGLGGIYYITGGLDAYESAAYNKWNGLKMASRINATNIQILAGGNYTNFSRNSASPPNVDFYFGARNADGTTFNYVNKRRSFQFLGSGITQSEMLSMESLIQAFNTTLGRQVSY
jgi:hypothetical protein